MLSVAEIMTPEPYTLSPDASLHDAAQLMQDHHIRHIPIVDNDNNVVGLVSHRDVLASSDPRLNDRSAQAPEERHVALSQVMSSPVQTVSESAELGAVASYLRTHRLGCLPVLRDGRLVGIISDSDFLEVAIVLMEQLELDEAEAGI